MMGNRIGPAIAALLLVACGTGEGTGSTTTTTLAASTTTAAATTTSAALDTTTTLGPSSTTTLAGTTTTAGSGGLPGEPIEFGPAEGDVVAVIGVAHDDVLNLRAAPGADQPILAGIPPLYDELVALGQTRNLPSSFWIAVDYDGEEGWVNLRYIAYLGATTDRTAAIIDNLGETPSARSMEDLGMLIAESLASEEPRSDLVMVSPPSDGDPGEVVFDVIDLGDDAVRGLRAHVFGQPQGGGYSLRSVEVTALCGRGADDEGACV